MRRSESAAARAHRAAESRSVELNQFAFALRLGAGALWTVLRQSLGIDNVARQTESKFTFALFVWLFGIELEICFVCFVWFVWFVWFVCFVRLEKKIPFCSGFVDSFGIGFLIGLISMKRVNRFCIRVSLLVLG